MLTIRAPGHVARTTDNARGVNTSPPRTTVRARTPTSDVLTTCETADGTPLIIRPDAGSSNSSASASTLRTTSTHPPDASGARTSNTEKSKLSDVDASTRDSSPAENCTETQDTRSVRLRCSTTTPFGRPVDPDV